MTDAVGAGERARRGRRRGAYDPAGRLDHVSRDGVLVAEYGYDADGNRTSLTIAQGQMIGVPDAQDRLATYCTLHRNHSESLLSTGYG